MKIPTNNVSKLYYWLSVNSITQFQIDRNSKNYENYTGWVIRVEDISLSYCNKNTRSFYYFTNGLAHREDGPTVYSFSDYNTLENIRYYVEGVRMLVVDTTNLGTSKLPEGNVYYPKGDAYYREKFSKVLIKEKLKMIEELE